MVQTCGDDGRGKKGQTGVGSKKLQKKTKKDAREEHGLKRQSGSRKSQSYVEMYKKKQTEQDRVENTVKERPNCIAQRLIRLTPKGRRGRKVVLPMCFQPANV